MPRHRLRPVRRLPPKGSPELARAFRMLGKGPGYAKLARAADLLREAGIEVEFNDELVEIAEANGSSGIDALDLVVCFGSGIEALTAGPRGRRVEA